MFLLITFETISSLIRCCCVCRVSLAFASRRQCIWSRVEACKMPQRNHHDASRSRSMTSLFTFRQFVFWIDMVLANLRAKFTEAALYFSSAVMFARSSSETVLDGAINGVTNFHANFFTTGRQSAARNCVCTALPAKWTAISGVPASQCNDRRRTRSDVCWARRSARI